MSTSAHIDGPAHDVRRAWWSCLLFVPSFVAAFVVGEGLLALISQDEGSVGVLTALTAGLPACAVFALPTLAVHHYAARARRYGDPGGRAPLLVAEVISAAFLAQNLLMLLVGSL